MDTSRQPRSIRRRLQLAFAQSDALGGLAILGIIAGLLAGGVVVLFRLLVESIQAGFLPDNNPENYEALAWWARLLLPIAGGLIIGLFLQALSPEHRGVGVVHVMERLTYHQARLPWFNGIVQFIGAALSIIAGHSVGREGPAIHLGAASGSLVGQTLYLSSRNTRVLVGCGVAAAVAAAFNTPLAGVILAMEVVLMEYTLAGFIPVILAAIAATIISRLVFGESPAFDVPPIELGTVYELPLVLIIGLAIGGLAALFIRSLVFFSQRSSRYPIWQRCTVAGVIVGICALFVPQIMGIGYDTVEATLGGQLGLTLVIAIVVFKLFATTAGLGLGLPGGLIGPTLVIGACAGSAAYLIALQLYDGDVASAGFYAMIGMGAMMGATLQAPLAALTAVLELTYHPHIVLPAMLAIVAACLVSRLVFKQESVFRALIKVRDLDYEEHPVAQAMRRIDVSKAMDREVTTTPARITHTAADALLNSKPHWILILCEEGAHQLMPARDLATALALCQDDEIDLLAIPGQRRLAAKIDIRASLQDASQQLAHGDCEALYVVAHRHDRNPPVLGILTHEDIEQHYRR